MCRQDKKRACYHITRISSSLEYESESKTSIDSTFPLYTSSPPPLVSPIPINSPLHYNMSQLNLHEIIRQQQEQLVAIQVQIQALLVGGAGEGEIAPRKVRRGGGGEVAKPQIFDRITARVAGFITACKLYIRMRMREKTVEGQI